MDQASGCPSIDEMLEGGRRISLHLADCPDCRIALRLLPESVLSEPRSGARTATAQGASRWSRAAVTLASVGDAQAPTPTDGADRLDLGARYEDLGRIGVGGMGEVRGVRDRTLGRTLAMKLISVEHVDRDRLVARFIEEAQLASQLQHPNIAPVHDVGELADGRLWFTMRQVTGASLADVIRFHHRGEGRWRQRRVIEVLLRVSEAVGYAHELGVVHRDLKPDNVMVGDHGEVWVLDWGLAKLLGRHEAQIHDSQLDIPGAADAAATRLGTVLGTPAYMAPEQARGEIDRIDTRTDVYALGALLYQVLTGAPPYRGAGAAEVLAQVRASSPPPPPDGPEELVALCVQSLASAPEDRPENGVVVSERLRAWLEKVQRREEALRFVDQSHDEARHAAALREESAALRAEAHALLADVPSWAPEQDKAPGWQQHDLAADLARRAELAEIAADQRLNSALRADATTPEAHQALLARHLRAHADAETARDDPAAKQAEARLRPHLESLPPEHAARRSATAYLRGEGALTLVTDPPGAEVLLYRYQLRNRRLVEVFDRSLGTTPLVEVPLPMGSYLCLLREPGHRDVCYPVSISRQHHWDGVPPGGAEPFPITLPREGELGQDECYVPAGWFWGGGDPLAYNTLPRQRVWVGPVVFDRYTLSNQQYITFLDDLVRQGREEEALRFVPRERAGKEDDQGPMIYRFDGVRFTLGPDADGDVWLPRYPASQVDWYCAVAYAAWRASHSGEPWRLPGEFEWEKAARGTDGRFFPWGDVLDPSWCSMNRSHSVHRVPAEVGTYAVDRSAYGICDLAGNSFNWCAEIFTEAGPARDRRLPPRPELADPDSPLVRVVRGGSWAATGTHARSANRNSNQPKYRGAHGGIRLARTWSRDD